MLPAPNPPAVVLGLAALLVPTRQSGITLALIVVRAIRATAAVSCSRLPRIVPPASLEEGGELPAGPSHRKSIKEAVSLTLTLQAGASDCLRGGGRGGGGRRDGGGRRIEHISKYILILETLEFC